ncbi:MAG: redoxin domain-containing protein [Gemmatimonadetes bacterium]|nr:redoxin domain-containing protein [Gemmatimonadota bacterium]NNM06849.1 redoxin domain-containing protein [Gemmatimonadota bacterium]
MRVVAALLLFGLPMLAPASDLSGQLQDPEIGAPSPTFTLPDTDGREHSLSDYAGKWVVLEWLNYGCPFVQKHYGSGNMQKLQAEYGRKGVVWLSVVSSAPGEQGYYEAAEMGAMNETNGNQAAAVLLDPEGVVGRAFGARTTPQMYLIDPGGVLLYNGAIDDRPSSRLSDIDGAQNYLVQAMSEAMSGNPVSQPTTQPYGCSVKYK